MSVEEQETNAADKMEEEEKKSPSKQKSPKKVRFLPLSPLLLSNSEDSQLLNCYQINTFLQYSIISISHLRKVEHF